MKTEIIIENTPSPFCTIHTKESTTAIENLAKTLRALDKNGNESAIQGWDKDYCIMVKPEDVYHIYSFDKKVFIKSKDEELNLKIRLYQFEELCEEKGWNQFIRVSNTDIVNINHILKFDLSLSGVIKIILKNDCVVSVSRRYMSRIKNRINILRGKTND